MHPGNEEHRLRRSRLSGVRYIAPVDLGGLAVSGSKDIHASLAYVADIERRFMAKASYLKLHFDQNLSLHLLHSLSNMYPGYSPSDQ